MSEIKFVKDKDYRYVYTAKKKMPSGMTAEVTFEGCTLTEMCGEPDYSGSIDFNIAMNVYKKRKQASENHLKVTGRDGVSTLIFAREAIKEFEIFIYEKIKMFKYAQFVVGWDDNRRRDVYYRGLKNMGFYYAMVEGNRHLIKKIKEPQEESK